MNSFFFHMDILSESFPRGASSNAVFFRVSGMILSACQESRASFTLKLWLNPFSHTAGVRAVAPHLCHSVCMHNLRQPAAARHTFFKNKVTLSRKSKCLQVHPDESSVKKNCIAFFNERKKLQTSMHPNTLPHSRESLHTASAPSGCL